MAATGVKISQMDATNTLAGDELVPIVQNGSNKSATISKIKEGLATEAWVIEAINNAGGKTVVVTELPTKGDVNKIYLIPNESSRANDVYDEYIYLITEQKTGWEFLGNKHVDVNLKDYYTKAEVNEAIEGVEGRTTSALALKVDKVDGKQLSTNDYTTSEKNKLQGIAANANNYTHPTTAGNKHLPAGGTVGQVLVNSGDGTGEWKDVEPGIDLTGLEDIYSYGVEWDSTVADPTLTRIGNPLLHKSLPVQSQYKGCVANGAAINYYLDPNDWSKKADGTPSVLDGTDGTVRVHIPKFYGKSGVEGTKRWVRMSTIKMDNTWIEIPEMLVDAYRSTVDTTVSATPKAVSVVNTTAQFRGGGNRTANDTYLDTDAFRSDLGKPRTNISRANMRTYATNAGSEMLCYEYYKWIFYWAWVIEYATFNSQATYNAELTADGYHQGGLGPGVTDWANAATSWSGYNATYPLTPCGYCNEFGNFTGVKDLVIPECTAQDGTSTVATHTFKVPRWRGFDNPFGDIWTNLDGVVIVRAAANEISTVYTTTNVSEFTDVVGEKTVAGYEVASDGYIKAFDLGETAEIIPSAVGGSATTYICDYHYCNVSSTALRALRVGGRASSSGYAGLSFFNSNNGVGNASSDVGFRTLNRVS